MIVVAVGLAVAYAMGVHSLARRGRVWPIARSLAAVGAIAAIAASEFAAGSSFTGHMGEHILLGMVAPLLLALSAPITLALQTTPPWLRPKLRRTIHSTPATWLSNPVVGLAVFGVSLIVLYLSPLLELSERHALIHAVVHVHLVAAGALFMWPLVGIDPIPRRVPFGARILTVLAAVPFHAFLGVAIMSTSSPLAPTIYPSLDDQHSAGGLLWVSGELMSLVLASIVVHAWINADRRAAVRADARES
jgi:putative membrane protein